MMVGEREQHSAQLHDLVQPLLLQPDDFASDASLLPIILSTSGGTHIQQQIAELGRLARQTRASMSGDTWYLVQDLRQRLRLPNVLSEHLSTQWYTRIAQQCLQGVNAIVGTLADNMVRDHTWTFVELGRRVQRGQIVARLIAVASANRQSSANELLMLLELADSAVTWRARHGRPVDISGLQELIGLDRRNPRSIAFQLDQCDALLRDLPTTEVFGDPVVQTVEDLRVMLDCDDYTQLEQGFQQLAEHIDHRWFSHALPVRSQDRSQELVE